MPRQQNISGGRERVSRKLGRSCSNQGCIPERELEAGVGPWRQGGDTKGGKGACAGIKSRLVSRGRKREEGNAGGGGGRKKDFWASYCQIENHNGGREIRKGEKE